GPARLRDPSRDWARPVGRTAPPGVDPPTAFRDDRGDPARTGGEGRARRVAVPSADWVRTVFRHPETRVIQTWRGRPARGRNIQTHICRSDTIRTTERALSRSDHLCMVHAIP